MNNILDESKITTYHKYVGKYKKFDSVLYNKYDVPLRELIKEQLGESVKDNEDIYNQDLIICDKNCKYKYLELQVCASWVNEKFPYDPYVYERKIKFSQDTLYIISNKHMDTFLLFDRESIIEKPTRIKKYSRLFVYKIPWYRIMRIHLVCLNMETINAY